MGSAAADFFDSIAQEYDSIALRAHPCYREMLAQVVAALPDSATNILELGCGTGALTTLLAAHYPAVRITGIDASEAMLAKARQRLAAAGLYPDERIAFMSSAFEQLSLPEGAYSLVTSNMSLHHLVDKAPFYAAIRRSLLAPGFFVFGDELRADLPHIEKRHFDTWVAFASQPGHLSHEELDNLLRHCEELDHYETLSRQLELLREAGFGRVDCVWRYLNYAVFAAQPG